MSNLTLYQCAADVQAVLNAHFDSETEAADTLEAVIGQFEVKAQSVTAYALNTDAEIKAIDEHIKHWQARKKALQNQSEQIKAYLLRQMQAAGIKEIKADNGTFTVKIAKNPPSVDVYDESLLPEHLLRVKTEPDKTAIKAALKAGEDVQGARMVTDGERLAIR